MALRCFLFSTDEGTSDVIRQVMTSLGLEGESCSQATPAVEKLTHELFQLVVIDWDQQPEAGVLISAARERKVAERPLVLAIVSDDGSVPKALQAGANSILRKPLVVNQVTDTMTTARDLLRSRQESAATAAAAAAAGASSSAPASGRSAPQAPLRPGEFLQSTSDAPSSQIETDTEVAHFSEQSAVEQTDPLKDLEPVASAVPEHPSMPLPQDQGDESKGLEWYLKARGVVRQQGSVIATTPATPKAEKPELLGYDQTSAVSSEPVAARPSRAAHSEESAAHEKKQEAQLFSYITGESEDSPERSEPRFRFGKRSMIAAAVLAAGAIVAAPQAPWHGRLISLTAQGRRVLHGWLNPQPVTVVTQAPTSHEDFARAGDEYKLPVAESIPDATTDPSQISVVPVIDPTAKKPAPESNPEQPAATPDNSTANPPDGSQPNPVPAATQPTGTALDTIQPISAPPVAPIPADTPPHTEASPVNPPAAVSSTAPPKPSPATPGPLPPPYTPPTTRVPSSLKSQMATMVPDASGNKPIDAALPSIEPVAVPELAERALLTDQPPLAYPPNAGSKQGTVTLQVLIGRDGTVQDAKFLQGSLAFARAAIDGVRQWKFKPYTLNGRPVSVQTSLTLKFAPAQ
jgi:TonB family protein